MTDPTQRMVQLTPHLWVAQSRSLLFNSGAFISAGQACLIDPGLYPDELEVLARLVAEQGAAPSVIVLTHSHWDHVVGPERFPGVTIIAQANYAALARREAKGILNEIARWEREMNVRRERPFRIPMPDEVFETTSAVNVGALTLQLLAVPGHAADQLAVYQAETGTLWAADILSDVEIPFVSDNLADYEKTLAALAELDIRVLVPGHGSPTTEGRDIRRRLADDRVYLWELKEKVKQAVRDGQTVEETVAACAVMRYRHRDQNVFYHQLNVESAYLELGGRADAHRHGWNRDWEKYPAKAEE